MLDIFPTDGEEKTGGRRNVVPQKDMENSMEGASEQRERLYSESGKTAEIHWAHNKAY